MKAVVLAAAHEMRTSVAAIPPPAKDPDEFLRAAGAEAGSLWTELVSSAPPGFEFGMKEKAAGLNLANPNHRERAETNIREWIAEFPEALWPAYRERAERWLGVPIGPPTVVRGAVRPTQPNRDRPQVPNQGAGNGLAARLAGKKLTVGRYLLQLLAVRPVAFDRVRTKITPDELDEGDRGIYQRMLESYERGGATGLENELAGYPAEEQDLIRRAWAAPPPSVDDEVAVELAERIRLDHMKGLHSGIIRELSEAESGKDSERVARLEAKARELARAITDLERRG